LNDRGSEAYGASEDDVADTKANQIASAQFTVHRKIEHGEIAGLPLMLKPGAQRPDVLRLQRRFRSDDAPEVPRLMG
jgi:hypothetical protein